VTVSYTELRRTLSVSDQEATAQRVLRIAGKDQERLLQNLFGMTFIAAMGFRMTKRAAHPHHSWLLAQTVSFVPDSPEDPPHAAFAANPGDPTIYDSIDYAYEYVRATITYRGQRVTDQWPEGQNPNPESQTYLTYHEESTNEMMALPEHGIVWSSDSGVVPPDVNAAIIVPTKTRTYDWHMVSDPPWTALDDLNGCVNDAEVWGRPAETLLFDGFTSGREYDSDGTAGFWNITLTIIERSISLGNNAFAGWNHVWRSNANPPWDRPKQAGTGTGTSNPARYMYDSGDFRELLRLE